MDLVVRIQLWKRSAIILHMNDYSPERMTVGQLFKGDRQLEIPRFQRSYEWKDANIEDFYNDFVRTSEDHLTFLGNIVVDVSNPVLSQIIDGQQRIITLTILCAAIRDLLREEIRSEAAISLASKIDTTYIQRGVSFSSELNSPYKLKTSRELEEFFLSYIQQGGERGRKAIPRTNSQKNVVKAYKRFREMLYKEKIEVTANADHQVRFLEQAMDRIHTVTLIVIEIYSQDAAYAIFESFNAKRVDLSVADLVKNYYFSKLKGVENEVSKNMDRWDGVVSQITSIPGGKVDRFLHYYLQSKEGKFTKSQLYRKIRNEIDAGPEKFIKNLEKATSIYAQLKDANVSSEDGYPIAYETLGKINNSLEGINRFNVEQCFILLISVLNNRQKFTPKYIAKIIQLIEGFTFVFSKIVNGQANVFESIYSDFASEINGDELTKEPEVYSGKVYSRIQKALIEVLPSYEVFESNFVEMDYSNPQQKRLIGYIFERIEIYSTRGGSELGGLANIDHIFPQNPPQGVKRPKNVHKIGNLLPIDRETNSKVGNKLPDEKIRIYQDVQNITQVKHYVTFALVNGTNMDDETITKRGKEIAKLAYDEVWSIK